MLFPAPALHPALRKPRRARRRSRCRARRLVRAVLAAGAVGAVAAGLAPATATAATAGEESGAPTSIAQDPPHDDQVVLRVGRIRAGTAPKDSWRDATIAMRDLFLARPELDMFDALAAEVLLARPTDDHADVSGDGYGRSSERMCGLRLCVHYVEKGRDAPASTKWVSRTLRTFSKVWSYEVGELGFRGPARDGRRGGDDRFDVYLTELGDRGLFGYCTPEKRVPRERYAASGYCVLDNDFDPQQYGAPARKSLKVTAAHEFLHAVQFGYDFREDPWLLESTATWVEEQFANGVNDNRRFLKYGSVRKPGIPLDFFANGRYAHYGTWAFWEHLSRKHGPDVVRRVWERADSVGDAPDQYSIPALVHVLGGQGALRKALTSYAVANLSPTRSYPEGDKWPRAEPAAVRTLDGDQRRGGAEVEVDHLAGGHVVFAPGRGLPPGQRLRVAVDAPGADWAAARVTVRTRGGELTRKVVDLDKHGRGVRHVAFDPRKVRSVVVTVVNASTRYRCDRYTLLACSGKPKDDNRAFWVGGRLGGHRAIPE